MGWALTRGKYRMTEDVSLIVFYSFSMKTMANFSPLPLELRLKHLSQSFVNVYKNEFEFSKKKIDV